MAGTVKQINYNTAVDFLLPKHFSGIVPQIVIAFGWYIDVELKQEVNKTEDTGTKNSLW